MFKRKVKTDEPINIQIGDVRFHILRIGARHVVLGVDAPDDVRIVFAGDSDDEPEPDGAV
jgi:sRNA-binding carbon storage regulator CsrA